MKSLSGKPLISAVDLFCGVGGLTCGLQRGGISVVAGVDVDPACEFPYTQNNSAKFCLEDIRNLESNVVGRSFLDGTVSLLAGCAPCQPFSTYNRSSKRKRQTTDWSLLLSFARIVRDTRPDLLTMENVPQLVDHPIFADFCEQLSDYNVSWEIVDCSHFRIPQTRKRLVLMGSRISSAPIRLKPSQAKKTTVRQTISRLPALAAGQRDARDPMHMASKLSPLNLERIKASVPGGTWRDWPEDLRAECHTKATGETYPSVYGRMEWDTLAPTITTQCFGYGNGRFGHPEQNRAISLREAAMLQTFPRNYAFVPAGHVPKYSEIGRLIGNAVPVRLGEAIARAFIDHVGKD